MNKVLIEKYIESNIYYVYAYLDPRKPGKYIYGDYSFEYEPFYVGKGSGKRSRHHLRETIQKTNNTHKVGKINKIKEQLNQEPIILFIKSNISEEESYKLEENYISRIGRSDLKKGPLTNQTNGGDGLKNHIFSKKHKENLSKANSGKKISEETKIKRAQNPPKNRKIVLQYSINNKFIAEFNSITEANKKTNISQDNIRKCCNLKHKTGGGFIWKFKYNTDISIIKNKDAKSVKKPILQYTINLEFINEYNSISEAARLTNFHRAHIRHCCEGKAISTGGFIWKFKK